MAVRRVNGGGRTSKQGLCTRLTREKDDDRDDKKKVETVLISTI